MKVFLLSLIFFATTTTNLAASENRANEEIDYLLNYISESGCTFIRNGKEYPSTKAAEHLQYKYGKVKNRIPDADTFIAKIASASSITRKQYEVQCGDERLPSGKWLKDALESFRLESRHS
ncbi:MULTISPECIES: DUF5329 family protein [Desulfosediminicola]|uniref:DUF5329 family protein n=1 Tax=Desulfosediminicola TaxID=2886823 RepID=UPI0010ACD566|nr:DUF5329 family protein [Desulfosediminicola ganghwensis]